MTLIPALTNEQKAKAEIDALLILGLSMLRPLHARALAIVWDDPNGLTPQQVCDAMGDQAAAHFTLIGMLTTLILTIDPSFVIPWPKKAFTKNPDGTVTILEDDYVIAA